MAKDWMGKAPKEQPAGFEEKLQERVAMEESAIAAAPAFPGAGEEVVPTKPFFTGVVHPLGRPKRR